ncbi:PIG-L deacetylase family protein [Streptomyces radicis]|uniref:GlcNAc-PI de-N-acetylase n=1 Tax=Streptomyces radicis TaxID=1750517 RepID=A0A3A9WBJ3_9ACTN|nr:PIG-L deacetylase family protein [Streptomyces radicis]RKN03367.1 GlcNAc-PI de-N-acetylase [Streptomyces radicis]RKN13224.1 GlcNAc-PI de-N-acetylase [Streptomyces radicis]
MLGLTSGDRVLVVAPHPDDETLGAGGTIARLTAGGVEVHVLAITCYPLPRWGAPHDSARRRAEFEAACDVLGVAGRDIAWVDDERARHLEAHLPGLIRLLEGGHRLSLESLRPAALLMPTDGAVHHEHRLVHRACYAAVRPAGAARHVPRIVLGFDGPEDLCWGARRPRGPVVVDITGHARVKDKALACYEGELRGEDHPRSPGRIRAIDTAMAAGVGAGRAEAFTPYRIAW